MKDTDGVTHTASVRWEWCQQRLRALIVHMEQGDLSGVHEAIISFGEATSAFHAALRNECDMDRPGTQRLAARSEAALGDFLSRSGELLSGARCSSRECDRLLRRADDVVDFGHLLLKECASTGKRWGFQRTLSLVMVVLIWLMATGYGLWVFSERNMDPKEREEYVDARLHSIESLRGLDGPPYEGLRETAVALERYYLQHGSYPLCKKTQRPWDMEFSRCSGRTDEWISGLVPEFLAALPQNVDAAEDPEQRRRFRYVTNGQGYKLFVTRDQSNLDGADARLADVVDPRRPGRAVAIWTDDAARW